MEAKEKIICEDYYPYGKILREYVNGEEERYQTTQHERDEETGLDYRGARYYDSDVARFLSLDPLATEFPAWSPYNYVFGNPISLIDPTGKGPEDWIKNLETGAVTWNEAATSQATTPEGHEYIGKEYMGLTVNKYETHNLIRKTGANIKLSYNDGSEGTCDCRWVQTVRTNVKLDYSKNIPDTYNDPWEGDSEPFYYGDNDLSEVQNVNGADIIFDDIPARWPSKDFTTWEGELSLVKGDAEGNYTPSVTIRWGFETQNFETSLKTITVTEPSDFQNSTIKEYNNNN